MGRYYEETTDEETTFDSLIGKTVTEVLIGDDTELVFRTPDGDFAYAAEGDCCSISWFSHITGLKNIIGEEIITVSQRPEFSKEEYEEAEKEGEYESLALYGFTIKTKKGSCDIEMRNDSNGYYGGAIYPIGTVSKDLKSVKGDI